MSNATPPSPLPPCPVTGAPALRRVHGVSLEVLADLWRYYQGVDPRHLFEGIDRLTLYESPCGLYFFHPAIAGDARFYGQYYGRHAAHAAMAQHVETRLDFAAAARHVQPGASVLDVGCGIGAFRSHVPHARYTGHEPFAPETADAAILRLPLEQLTAERAESFDVVTAFHVIEHTADPLAFARLLVGLLKPGGHLILAAPLHPSPLTEIPNFLMNLPPHHTCWWNERAFAALAGRLGLEVVTATRLAPSAHQGRIHWLHRLLAVRTQAAPQERYVAHRWSWHMSIIAAYLLSGPASRLRALPRSAREIDAFLVARKAER